VRRWVCAKGSASWLLLSSAPLAAAQPEQRPIAEALQLDWRGGCLQRAALAASIAHWLEREQIDSRLTIRLTGREQPELEAEFELFRERQRLAYRAFRDVPGDCEDLTAALGFTIALSIDAAPGEPASRKRLAQAPVVPREKPQLQAAFYLESFAAFDPLPGLAPGASAGFALVGARLRFAAGPVGTLPRSVTIAEGSARMWRAGARLEACWLVAPSWAIVPRACALTQGGAFGARGAGYAEDRSSLGPWLSAGVRGALMWHMTRQARLGPGASLDGWIVRPRARILSEGGSRSELHGAGWLGFSAGLSFERTL
jgi:hypothetical protein